jgi:hypothetical protein
MDVSVQAPDTSPCVSVRDSWHRARVRLAGTVFNLATGPVWHRVTHVWHRVTQVMRRAGRFLGAALTVVIAGALVWYAWSLLTTLPSWIRITVWPPAFGVMVLASAWFYRRLWRGDRLSGTGLVPVDLGAAADTVLVTLFVWFLLTAPFAFGTYLFDRERLLAQLEPNERTGDAFLNATYQYTWHAADVVPFIKATETLNWTEPSRGWKEPTDTRAVSGTDASDTGYSTGTGVLLVIYKILVLAPVLAAARLAWVAARGRREGTDDVARAESGSAEAGARASNP